MGLWSVGHHWAINTCRVPFKRQGGLTLLFRWSFQFCVPFLPLCGMFKEMGLSYPVTGKAPWAFGSSGRKVPGKGRHRPGSCSGANTHSCLKFVLSPPALEMENPGDKVWGGSIRVILKMWCPDQVPQHHLGAWKKGQSPQAPSPLPPDPRSAESESPCVEPRRVSHVAQW